MHRFFKLKTSDTRQVPSIQNQIFFQIAEILAEP